MIAKRNGNSNESNLPYTPVLTTTSGIEVGNINQIGYEKAGRNNGDPSALSNSLELVKSGHIVDENSNKEKKDEARLELDKEINDRKISINSNKGEIEKIDVVRIPSIDAEIEDLHSEIRNKRTEAINGKYNRNRFNLLLYWIVFIPGTIYLYLFYVSAIHSALFRNIAGEVASANQDNIGLILNNVFNITAFREFNIHWFAPVIFFVFAIILHISLATRPKIARWVSVFSVILFVFIADGLLAYYIEKNSHLLSKLMGLDEGSWTFYTSSGFYLVLFFGFFTSMGWSIMLHKIAGEYSHKDIELKAGDEIAELDKAIRQLRFEKGEVNSLKIDKLNASKALEEEIRSLELRKSHVHYSNVDLEKNVDDFYNGWLSYLNGLRSDVNKKQECESIYNQFKNKNFNHSTNI